MCSANPTATPTIITSMTGSGDGGMETLTIVAIAGGGGAGVLLLVAIAVIMAAINLKRRRSSKYSMRSSNSASSTTETIPPVEYGRHAQSALYSSSCDGGSVQLTTGGAKQSRSVLYSHGGDAGPTSQISVTQLESALYTEMPGERSDLVSPGVGKSAQSPLYAPSGHQAPGPISGVSKASRSAIYTPSSLLATGKPSGRDSLYSDTYTEVPQHSPQPGHSSGPHSSRHASSALYMSAGNRSESRVALVANVSTDSNVSRANVSTDSNVSRANSRQASTESSVTRVSCSPALPGRSRGREAQSLLYSSGAVL